MRFRITVSVINSEFNQEYANEYHFGKESDTNRKYYSSNEYGIDDMIELIINENSYYNLKGELPNTKSPFCYKIPNLYQVKAIRENGEEASIYVSNSLISTTHKAYDAKHKITRYYIYVKDDVPFVKPLQHTYIDLKDFPKELLSNE